MVDDTTVITDEAHLGQAASRGNPQLSRDHLPQHPQQQFQPILLVYDDMPERLSAPLHRMRRSVSHELPPRMDTHHPDSPSPSSLTPTDPPAPDSSASPSSTLHSPHSPVTDISKDSDISLISPKDSRSSYPHNSEDGNSNTDESFLVSSSESPSKMLDSFLTDVNTNQEGSVTALPSSSESGYSMGKGLASEFSSQHHSRLHVKQSLDNTVDPAFRSATPAGSLPVQPVVKEAKVSHHVSLSNDETPLNGPSRPKGNVFDPVVDVVEYFNDEANVELPDTDDVVIIDENEEDDLEEALDISFTHEEEITDNTDDYEKELDSYEATEDSDKDVQKEDVLSEYEYGRNPESDVDIVEYIQVNETEGNSSALFTDLSEDYEVMNSSRGKNASAELLPASLSSVDLGDIMVGDDPLAYNAQKLNNTADVPSNARETINKERKIFRSWMGGFPKLSTEPSEVDNSSGESLSNDTERQPAERDQASMGLKSSVDTWFSRYGMKNSPMESTNGKTANDKGSGHLFSETENERFLFDSSENNGERVSRKSASRRERSYDPNDPRGGPIPQSDPGNYPSSILEALGVPYYQDPTKSPPPRKNNTYKGPVTARDIFPHIFEYDLENHDDYYYEDDTYYYTDEYTVDSGPAEKADEFEDVYDDDDDSVEIIFDDDEEEDDDNIGEVQAAHRDHLTLLPHSSTPVRATLYPPDLQAMSLTKEEFHVPLNEPQIRPLSQGQEDVVEIKVIPLERNFDSASSMDSGTSYSPSLDNHKRETTIERKIVEASTPVATTTSSPTPLVTSTKSHPVPPMPEPLPEHLPPLQVAKFLPTRPPQHRDTPLAEVSSEGKKIPKFLMHIAEGNSAAPRDSGPSDTTSHQMPVAQSLNDGLSGSELKNTPHFYSSGSSASHATRKNYENQDEVQKQHNEGSHTKDQVVSLLDNSRSRGASLPSGTKEETLQENEASRDLRYNRSSPPYSSSSHVAHATKSGRSNRVTVNVTIATDDGGTASGRGKSQNSPLYVLSVSVPTSGKNQEAADITLLEPNEEQQIATLSIMMNQNNNTYVSGSNNQSDSSQASKFFAPPQNEFHTQLASGHEQKAQCQCPCACDSDKTETSNSIPAFSQSLPNSPSQSRLEEPLATTRLNVPDSHTPPRGCALDPNPTTTSSTTTTTPPHMVGVVKEIEGETEHPHSFLMEPELITNWLPGKITEWQDMTRRM